MRKSLLVGCAAIFLVGLSFTAAHAEDGAVLAGYECRSDPFSPGARLFNNRGYVLADPPECLAGMTFLRMSIDGVSFQCLKPGVLYALSPTPGRRGVADQEAALLAAGFDKLDEPEFQLFGDDAINRVSIYRKEVAAREGTFLRQMGSAAEPGAHLSRARGRTVERKRRGASLQRHPPAQAVATASSRPFQPGTDARALSGVAPRGDSNRRGAATLRRRVPDRIHHLETGVS